MMKVILMNQNKKVLLAEMDESNTFQEIYEYYNINYAPLSLYNAYNHNEDVLVALNSWFKGRGIPAWRQNIEKLLEKLNVVSPTELLNKAYGLSLSDQYWIKGERQNLKWKDINFFTNDFEYKDYLDVSLNSNSRESSTRISLHSPNNTTDGMVKKGWIIDKDNNRVLVKGTYSISGLEPINEWLASRICKRLDLDYCNYTLDILRGQLVSKCKNFLTKDEEIISASDIMNLDSDDNVSDYEKYVSILESYGIKDVKKKLSDMYIVDYLMLNTDRHMKNYGIIRNVKTLEWERITPIFDTGTSLQSDVTLPYLDFDNEEYKFFHSHNMTVNELVNYIKLEKYDLTKLDGLKDEYKEVLEKYSDIIELNPKRLEKTVEGFGERIELLKQAKEKYKDVTPVDFLLRERSMLEKNS